MDYTKRYRQLRIAGADRDSALKTLRSEGADFGSCIKAVRQGDELSLRDAKALVHNSSVWADEKENRELFWEAALDSLEHESEIE